MYYILLVEQMFLFATAVVFGNILTVMLVYGMRRAFKIRRGDELDGTTAVCIILPLGFFTLGMLAFT